jgi:hypothetical protein
MEGASMSRFSFNINGTDVPEEALAGHPKEARYQVSFGYDNPCTEYFIHVEQLTMVNDPEEENLLFAVASYNTLTPHPSRPDKIRYSNGELLELFQAWGVPSTAQEALALDQPF